MRVFFLCAVAAGLLSGCSIVSVNSVFPHLAGYWSAEAKEQRAERAEEKAYGASQRTNSAPVRPVKGVKHGDD